MALEILLKMYLLCIENETVIHIQGKSLSLDWLAGVPGKGIPPDIMSRRMLACYPLRGGNSLAWRLEE